MLAEQTREESKLKYLMYMSLLEPYDKNVDKMFKIEKKRTEENESWGKEQITPIYSTITTGNSFMIIDTDDPVKLAKYRLDYAGVLDIEIHAIQEFSKLRDLYK